MIVLCSFKGGEPFLVYQVKTWVFGSYALKPRVSYIHSLGFQYSLVLIGRY